MSNDYFKFKQFTIHQDRCAMKVTSLACIQGAWLPDIEPVKILDIGAGTGLLTLMTAQKYSNGQIDAVEIEPSAYRQLSENIAQSPWKSRIHCHQKDILSFAKESSTTYDFIITNPPFYENQLKSGSLKVNHARHDISLTINDLVLVIDKLLSSAGLASVLLPMEETEKFVGLSKVQSIFPFKQLIIKDNPKKDLKATVTLVSKTNQDIHKQLLIIKNSENIWSHEYKTLLRPYYLNL